MDVNVKERLLIKKFLSIEYFDWEIKEFNVITGDMGSGKSLCLKLLHFFEQAFYSSIFKVRGLTKESFTIDKIYTSLTTEFRRYFFVSKCNYDFSQTSIVYTYECNGQIFEMNIHWGSAENNIKIKCDYIEKKLQHWRSFFKADNTPETSLQVRENIAESISRDFSNTFPISSIFIPASRAITTVYDMKDTILDPVLERFMELKSFEDSFDSLPDENIDKILRVKKIYWDENKKLMFEVDKKRIVPLAFASSGQQELTYLLFMAGNLYRTQFLYGEKTSIFIEEPSAHLFPRGQKETVEYLVKMYNSLKKGGRNIRFFISTHSPYLLNVINNMLEKGRLEKEITKMKDMGEKQKIQEAVQNIPGLSADDLSAHIIQDDGKVVSMITGNGDDKYLYSDLIESITNDISHDADDLSKVFKELKNKLDG
jgi:predicted ATPase